MGDVVLDAAVRVVAGLLKHLCQAIRRPQGHLGARAVLAAELEPAAQVGAPPPSSGSKRCTQRVIPPAPHHDGIGQGLGSPE